MTQRKVKMKVLPYGKKAEAELGERIFDVLSDLNLDVTSICGGRGICGKCKVEIKRGVEFLSPITTSEGRLLSEGEIKRNVRLACQTITASPGEVEVYVPRRSTRTKQVLQIKGLKVKVKPKPLVRKYFVQVEKPCLEDVKSDEDRLLKALQENFSLNAYNLKFEYGVLKKLPLILRKSGGKVTVVIWANRIIGVEQGDTTNRLFGFAVDVGTTKLAGYLVDLNTGEILSGSACMNPQISAGEDVISRISHVMQKGEEGLNQLQREVVQAVNLLLERNCEKAGVKMQEVYEYSLVGNTCMQLLFLGIWPEYLALSPYTPVVRRSVDVQASKLGLKGCKQANAHFLPIIGGFVGADNVAVLLSTKMFNSDEVCMAIDIGTNTEIDLGNKEALMAVSCASGPAFEGMQIEHGMTAALGAIERISINPHNFDVDYLTIQGGKPRGICGSAMIDVLSELFLTGLINKSGRFNKEMMKKTKRLKKSVRGYEFVLAWKEETSINRNITFTQKDVREIQKAKAAIHVGATTLMRKMGYSEEDIGKLFIAGAFGNYIDPENAMTIGMYPEFAIDKIKNIGNAAGTGSRLALLSTKLREEAERISRKAVYFELAADPRFQKEYIDSLYIPHADLDRYPVTNKRLLKMRTK